MCRNSSFTQVEQDLFPKSHSSPHWTSHLANSSWTTPPVLHVSPLTRKSVGPAMRHIFQKALLRWTADDHTNHNKNNIRASTNSSTEEAENQQYMTHNLSLEMSIPSLGAWILISCVDCAVENSFILPNSLWTFKEFNRDLKQWRSIRRVTFPEVQKYDYQSVLKFVQYFHDGGASWPTAVEVVPYSQAAKVNPITQIFANKNFSLHSKLSTTVRRAILNHGGTIKKGIKEVVHVQATTGRVDWETSWPVWFIELCLHTLVEVSMVVCAKYYLTCCMCGVLEHHVARTMANLVWNYKECPKK